jgi:tRNA(fMet)-specific endonuclease VapC
MRRYLLDSNAVNAFVNGHEPLSTRVRSARLAGARVGTCEPIVAEMYFGLRLSKSPDENVAHFERELRYLRCWPFDRAAARAYGTLAADLRRRGRTMQVFDMMLAAVALTMRDCVVVTTDSDLSAIPGLRVEDWMALQDPRANP